MTLTHPSTLNVATRKNPSVHLIYGAFKIGKTSVCAAIPDSYLLELASAEGKGADFVDFKGSKIDSLNDLEEAIPQLSEWYKEGLFKRLILDTVDSLDHWLERRQTDNYRAMPSHRENAPVVQSIYEMSFGKGHNMVRPAFKDILADLQTCCDEMVLIAHLKPGSFDKTEQTVVAGEIALPGKLGEIICCHADAIGYMYRPYDNENERWITYAANDTLKCGSRSNHLSGKQFKVSTRNEDGSLSVDWSEIYVNDDPGSSTESTETGAQQV